MARDPKHDILFEPIQIGPKTTAEPLLPDPALQRRRLGEAAEFQAHFRAMKAEGG